MTTEQIMEIIKVRETCSESNPTSKSLLFEIYKAMERLKQYEEKEERELFQKFSKPCRETYTEYIDDQM